ncbi:hypothetical protein [Schlesneria paludicola]|uniref:hypothetical protein n=1 Tax=Schlesneria paludicola TaxID=360056 RepID=UPI00029AFEF2|nr:hypothetical protein [Schlesneria paludicola]
MQTLLIVLAMFTQAEVGLPPAPAPELPPVPAVQSVEEMRAWLLSRLIVDMSFDAQKSLEVKQLMETMNEPQMRALIAAYKEQVQRNRAGANDPLSSRSPLYSPAEQQLLDQAKLDRQQAEAYRDHLKREYDRQLLQGQMTQNLVYQNIVNNQRAMFQAYGPFMSGSYAYGPLGYGGLGYGVVNYGGFGYGAPGFGGPTFYGLP